MFFHLFIVLNRNETLFIQTSTLYMFTLLRQFFNPSPSFRRRNTYVLHGVKRSGIWVQIPYEQLYPQSEAQEHIKQSRRRPFYELDIDTPPYTYWK